MGPTPSGLISGHLRSPTRDPHTTYHINLIHGTNHINLIHGGTYGYPSMTIFNHHDTLWRIAGTPLCSLHLTLKVQPEAQTSSSRHSIAHLACSLHSIHKCGPTHEPSRYKVKHLAPSPLHNEHNGRISSKLRHKTIKKFQVASSTSKQHVDVYMNIWRREAL